VQRSSSESWRTEPISETLDRLAAAAKVEVYGTTELGAPLGDDPTAAPGQVDPPIRQPNASLTALMVTDLTSRDGIDSPDSAEERESRTAPVLPTPSVNKIRPTMCTRCGSDPPLGSKYCPTCGAPTSGTTGSAPHVSKEAPTARQQRSVVNRIGWPLPQTQPSQGSKNSRKVLVGAIVGVILVVAAIGAAVAGTHNPQRSSSSTGARTSAAATGSSTSHTISGSFEVIYPTAPAAGTSCYVPPAWGSESDGDQVVVMDGTGSTLGIGTLTNGTSTGLGEGCRFSFSVPSLSDASFYSVLIDGHSGPQYSESQLQAQDWNVVLSLTP